MSSTQIAVDALAAMDRLDFDALAVLLAPDIELVSGGVLLHGHEEVFPMVQAASVAFPDLAHTVVNTIEDGDTVGLQMQINATHSGDYVSELGTFPGTGRPITWNSSAFVTVRAGRAQIWTAYMDMLAIHRGVGFGAVGQR